MKNFQKVSVYFLCMVLMMHLLTHCGGSTASSTGDTDDSGTEDAEGSNEETSGGSGGTVTLSGILQYTSGDGNIAANKSLYTKATAASSYKAFIVNTSTGAQAMNTVGSDGSFSFTVGTDASYIVSFIDNNYNYVGTLVTDSVGEDASVPIALTTCSVDGSITNVGVVTANTTTGQVISDQTLVPDTNHMAATSGGIITGGTSGEGSTNYETSQVTDSVADASDPDDDNDGVPDLFDTDNNNNGYADEIDGVTDYCAGGEVSLYINNYPGSLAASAEQQQFPRPSEINANLGTGTQYVIYLEVSPLSGSAISDISSISVASPSYIDTYGTIYHLTNGEACFNELWANCSTHPKKMFLSGDGTKFIIGLARNTSTYVNTDPILENMFPGDTFVLNFTMADGTTHVCTKKINIIPKYFAYNLKKGGILVDTSVSYQSSWSGSVELSWAIPSVAQGGENAVGPAGMTYKLGFVPYDENCNPDAENEGFIVAGQDATSKTISIPADVDAVANSPINYWGLKIYSMDDIGDSSYTGSVQFTDTATRAAVCD